MKKNTILIFALSRNPWVGGIYYRKNIINMMLSNNSIKDKYNIVVIVNNKYAKEFNCFENSLEIVKCRDDANIITALSTGFKCFIKYRIKYVFPIMPYPFFKLLGITPVSWIADFQHCHYPEYFDQKEIKKRNKNFTNMAIATNPLILSSNSCKEDLEHYFIKNRENVYIVPFTSYIDDDVNIINDKLISEVLGKYNIKKNNYVAICNQFWKHKNHKTVFEAISKLKNEEKYINTKFVFTGELSDRRNPDYINELLLIIKHNKLENNIVITGFIDRISQLIIMKESLFVIQPSLFEGWGTVVEDAKVLNKRVILSDIPVHKEQANDNCVFFESLNKDDLVDKIKLLLDNKDSVISNKSMTYEYSKVLSKVFK